MQYIARVSINANQLAQFSMSANIAPHLVDVKIVDVDRTNPEGAESRRRARKIHRVGLILFQSLVTYLEIGLVPVMVRYV